MDVVMNLVARPRVYIHLTHFRVGDGNRKGERPFEPLEFPSVSRTVDCVTAEGIARYNLAPIYAAQV
jgi:hypothetical protein